MKKKVYIVPEAEVFEWHATQALLAGSVKDAHFDLDDLQDFIQADNLEEFIIAPSDDVLPEEQSLNNMFN